MNNISVDKKTFLDIDGRISSLGEFMSLKGKEVWVVTVPSFVSDNKKAIHGNSFLNSWVVDDCYDDLGTKITDVNDVHSEVYTPHATKTKVNNNQLYKYLISLITYNVIDNHNDFLHAIFYGKDSAEIYRTWLAVKFGTNDMLNFIDDRIINGKLINWEEFLSYGIQEK